MSFYRSLKLGAVVAFLFLRLSLCGAKEEPKTTWLKGGVATTEKPVRDTSEKSASTVSDTTDLFMKAMDDFHETMAPLWHEAYPKKDFKSIREQAPQFQKKLYVLLRSPLPTNLEKEKLDSLIAKRQWLSFYVSQLGLAAADTVDSVLASALEQLHWAYEEMEKVFAVEIKELDRFHQTLYFLWHEALPKKDYKSIKKTVIVLKAEMDSLMKVPLSYGCREKKEEFEKRKSALKEAVYQLALVCEKGTNQKIEEAMNLMHERFMELNRLLR